MTQPTRCDRGSNATYTVELATEPSGQVTVTVDGANGTDLTVVNGSSLTFTASTWNTAQTVEVRAGEDDDASNDSATLSHTAVGADYGSVTEDLPVTVTDNDTAGIVLTPTTLRVTEGSNATYTVELATEPSGQVTVTVDGADGTDLTVVNGSSLTFTDSTWNTAQTVEVRAGEDDDASEDSATLSHTAVGADYGSVTEDLPVTVTDNDTAGIVLTPTTLGVTEGSSATYTVELATEPSGQVTVTVDGANGTDLTVVNGGSLTFTDSTWNTAQTVKVRADEDDDASNDSATLTHTGSGADYGSVTEDLPVTITDSDTAGIVLTPTYAPSDRRQQRNLHGGAVNAAQRPSDGDRGRSQRHGPERGQRRQPDVHRQHLEHGADGGSACRRGRRRLERQRDADPHGIGRRLRLGDEGPARHDHRQRHRRHRADPDYAPSDRRQQRNLHGGAVNAAQRPGDGDRGRSQRHGPDGGQRQQPDVHRQRPGIPPRR